MVPTGLYHELGKRIRSVRESKNLTQEALAESVSMTRPSIVNIEKGRQRVPVHTLVRIAEALSVDPSHLLPPLSREDRLAAAAKDYPDAIKNWITAIAGGARDDTQKTD